MNLIKLAEKNVKASFLKKVFNLSALNCCKWSVENYFNHCLTGWNSFHRLHMDVQAEESEFQTSAPCANLIKMKTRFQFILMNWNIASPKMVRATYLRDKQEKYPGYASRNSFFEISLMRGGGTDWGI